MLLVHSSLISVSITVQAHAYILLYCIMVRSQHLAVQLDLVKRALRTSSLNLLFFMLFVELLKMHRIWYIPYSFLSIFNTHFSIMKLSIH